MARTKKQRKSGKKKKSQKKGVAGKFNNKYFTKLDKKSVVVKNMISNLNNTEDFKGFILDLPAKYYEKLIVRQKKEVFELIVEYLETNEIIFRRKPKIHTFVLIGLLSVAKLLEMEELFRATTIFFASQIVGQKLQPKTKEILYRFADLIHPDDLIVKETFEKNYYENNIFSIFNNFINWSIENVENLDVLRKLFNMGFHVRNSYRDSKDIKVHRTEEVYSAIKSGSLELLKILVENGQRNPKIEHQSTDYLNWAVYFERMDIIKYLVEDKKLRIDKVCMNTWVLMDKPEDGTPLYNAVLKENVEIVKYLIEKGADIDYDSNGPYEDNIVLAAVKRENFEILKILVEAGADLDTQNPEGIISYEYALEHLENEEMAEYLKANGARTEVNEDEVRPDYDPY